MAQITWERSVELVGAAEKVLLGVMKLVNTPGSGAIAKLDDLLNDSRTAFRQAVDLEQQAFDYEAGERKAKKAGLDQMELNVPPGERPLVAWKNEQGVVIKAWEEGETSAPVVLQPGEEMTCFNPEKVAWTVLEGVAPGETAPAAPKRGRKARGNAPQVAQEPETTPAEAQESEDTAPALEEAPSGS